MIKRTLKHGEVLFARGDAADYVYAVKSGGVAVMRPTEPGGEMMEVARIGAGEVVGEMAALSGTPHESTVVAVGDCEVTEIERGVFLSTLEQPGGPALELLRSAIARLRAMNERIRDTSASASSPLVWTHIHLEGGSAAIARQMPPKGYLVRNLPFCVGRHAKRGNPPPAHLIHLAIDDSGGMLAPVHFSIEDGYMAPVVRDHGTTHGTLMNGMPLGGSSRRLVAPLHPGPNEIVVGHAGSTCRFRATLLCGSEGRRASEASATGP